MVPRNHPVFDQPTTPMSPARRRNDNKLLVLAGIGGLILIAAPVVAFSQASGPEPVVTEPGNPGVVPEAWNPPRPVTVSPLPGGPAAVDNARRLTLLARGQDNTVLRNFTASASGAAPSGWTNLGGSAVGAPVGVRDGHGELAAFFVGTDGNLFYKNQAAQAQAPTTEWVNLKGAKLVGTPAVAPNAQGKLLVAARANDGTVRVIQQNQIGSDDWTEWSSPLPVFATSDLAIHRDAQGKLRIFGIGLDEKLWEVSETRLASNDWAPPANLGGTLFGVPSVAMDGQGRLCVFALGEDGSLMSIREADAASREWLGWQNLGHRLAGNPIAVPDARGTVMIYGLNEDGSLQEIWAESSDAKPVNHGGNIAELVGVAQDSTGRIYVYGIGKKGDMEGIHQTQPASGPWTNWSSELGGVFLPSGG
ncbi:hypothetical protein AB0L13_44290 [Saccharopolyspora shandongensis]|uniref:hypothetical protein n=1 Tax=Saccharopolyspora shandongensis TaxID=418495 RepID=UPI00342B3F27